MTVNKLFDSSPILTTLNIKEKGSNWTNHEKSFVYRVVFEQLKNVVKHSSAKHCNISVYKKNEEYHLEVSDDGIGIDLTQLRYGTGFSKIHYIIEALDGQYHIKTGAGMGFTLAVSFPVEKAIN